MSKIVYKGLLILISTVMVGTLFGAPAQAANQRLPIESCKVIGNNTTTTPFRFEDAGHIENWSQFVRPIGTIRMLVLPFDFSDVPAQVPAKDELKYLKRVKKFFADNSNSKMELSVDAPFDWIRMPKPASYYKTAFWAEKINDAIDLVDPKIDFSKYDLVLFYISKENKITTEAGALPGFPDRKPDGLGLIRGVYLGNDYWRQQGQDDAVTIHEMLHVFGLPDLYQVNKDGSKNAGAFDLMAEYVKSVGMRLYHWNRWKLGWIEDEDISCLDPKSRHTISINKSNSQNEIWVFPINDKRMGVIQAWQSGNTIKAIAYRVDFKDFVWNSAGLSGSGESPIQMLRPVRSGAAPKDFANRNLSVVIQSGDVIKGGWGTLRAKSFLKGIKIEFIPK